MVYGTYNYSYLIAKLVQITPITMVYGTYNELVIGAFVNQLITFGAPHCK